MERHARRNLASEINRQRFDRAKRFVDQAVNRGGAVGFRMHARWLKFLCSRPAVQRDIYSDDAAFLRRFAAAYGLSPEETRKFVGLSLLGRVWGVWCLQDLYRAPPQFVAKLTRVEGWEHFERCIQDGAGLIVLPVHGQFSRLFQRYLRHRGYDGLELGLTNDRLEQRGFQTPIAKRFELARQMHAAKQTLNRGGIVFNLPDARQNLDNARTVDFFGRQRQLALGFAELALETGAHVVPVAYRFTPRGVFAMEFGEPFRVPGPQTPREERVESLVNQYASFLRDEWRRYPWNIHWNHLRYYCDLPEVADDNDDAGTPGVAEFSLESVQQRSA
jgi:lauroyl/myristoyl acyltransferase